MNVTLRLTSLCYMYGNVSPKCHQIPMIPKLFFIYFFYPSLQIPELMTCIVAIVSPHFRILHYMLGNVLSLITVTDSSSKGGFRFYIILVRGTISNYLHLNQCLMIRAGTSIRQVARLFTVLRAIVDVTVKRS